MKRLPVVYVRGFAGGTSGINKHVDDPFYGFNDGCTHVRVDGDGKPSFYQFESPLLRLMVDEGYRLLVHGDQRAYLLQHDGEPIDQNSIWIYRFYDEAATTFGAPAHHLLLGRLVHGIEDQVAAPKGFNIEAAAEKLYDFIMLIREKTGADKDYLVAHSMGGLVAPSMLQKVSQSSDAAGKARVPPRIWWTGSSPTPLRTVASILTSARLTGPWRRSGLPALTSSRRRRCMATFIRTRHGVTKRPTGGIRGRYRPRSLNLIASSAWSAPIQQTMGCHARWWGQRARED